MRSVNFCIYLLLGLFFLVAACQDEKGKNDYSGVSELISNRNKARYEVAENTPKKTNSSKKNTPGKIDASKSRSDAKKEEFSSIILYEESVEIKSSKSGKILAKGAAYINKRGQIVRIKILKE